MTSIDLAGLPDGLALYMASTNFIAHVRTGIQEQ